MRKRPYGFEIYLVNVKTMRTIVQIFVAFSEKLNFLKFKGENSYYAKSMPGLFLLFLWDWFLSNFYFLECSIHIKASLLGADAHLEWLQVYSSKWGIIIADFYHVALSVKLFAVSFLN